MMASPVVLVCGAPDETLTAALAEMGATVRTPGTLEADCSPDVVIAAYSSHGDDRAVLVELRQRHPGRPLLLAIAPEEIDDARAAARMLDAELLPLPADRRRTLDTLEQAFARSGAHQRAGDLAARVTALDPGLGEEVRALADQLDAKTKALDEAVRLRSSFIANISHEIRTPVTIMQGMLDVLIEDLRPRLSSDDIELLERVQLSGENLLDLVQGILDLSKADAGVLENRPTRVLFPDLVAQLVERTQSLLGKKPVELVTDVERGIEWLTVDVARLRQVLTGLLSNAAKFTVEGEIRLAARLVGQAPEQPGSDPATLLRAPVARGDTLEIVVSDTGCGIPPEHRELIFEAFRQVDVSQTRAYEGIGIGLTIVREMAHLLDASMELESEPGAGSRFTIRLPVTRAEPTGSPARVARRSPVRRRRIHDPRGVLPELAHLFRTPPASPADAVTFALDFVDRLGQPAGVVFVEDRAGRWIVADSVGEAPSPQARSPLPSSAEDRLATERQPFRDGEWTVVSVSAGLARPPAALAARHLGVADDEENALRLLLVASRWLGLELALQGLEEERDEIVALIGRDVKTPLGSLLGTTHSLLRGLAGDLAPRQRTAILGLERALHRTILSSLDLLDYPRALDGRLAAPPKPFPLVDVVDHVLSRHSAAIELGRHPVEREIPPDLPLVHADEIRTDRSVSNLVRAILERLPEEETLSIRATPSREGVVCEIEATVNDLRPFDDTLGGMPRPPAISETLSLRIARLGIEAQGGGVSMIERDDRLVIRLTLPRGA